MGMGIDGWYRLCLCFCGAESEVALPSATRLKETMSVACIRILRGTGLALLLAVAGEAAQAGGGVGSGGLPAPTTCFDAPHTYLGCLGPFATVALSTPSGQPAELAELSHFGNSWAWQGKSNDPSFGPFAANPVGSTNLTFDAPVTGLFVIALTEGTHASYYEYNGDTAGIASLPYDMTGVAVTVSMHGIRTPVALSHAALYTVVPNVNPAPVPEPQSYALLLAGLGVLALIARPARKRR